MTVLRHNTISGLLIICSAFLFFSYEAASADQSSTDFRSRAVTQEEQGIRVTAGVPSRDETKAIFNTSLYKRNVQPVWLEITNMRDEAVTFLPAGLDPKYFSPMEAANLDLKGKQGGGIAPLIDQQYFNHGMSSSVPAGETRNGYIFTGLDEGTKAFNVDIVSTDFIQTFTFFIQVPGLRVDHYEVDWENLYPPDEEQDLSEQDLIEYLEEQTCCTSDKKAEGSGDPVNLVVIGTPEEVYAAFIRAGWDETETITSGTMWKTAKSFIGGGEYRYSPVSGLYVYQRPQDIAFQKARSNIHERNHLRLWLSPVRFNGEPVWLGQISRDIGVRFTTKTITTHKIDPDVDETREFLLEDLVYSQAVEKLAYVHGAIAAPIGEPRGNLTGDPYFTDGFRLVMWVTSLPVNLADVKYVKWRHPADL